MIRFFVLVVLFCMSTVTVSAGECGWPLWYKYSAPGVCYYFTNVTTTQGPTNCRESLLVGDCEAECEDCDGEVVDYCDVSTEKQKRKKMHVSGSISYWGLGIDAETIDEEVIIAKCNKHDPVKVNCTKLGDDKVNEGCRESWIEWQNKVVRADLYKRWSDNGDTAECNGSGYTDGIKMCYAESQIKKFVTNHCGHCSEMDACE